MSFKERWEKLEQLGIGHSFCPPSTKEYPEAMDYFIGAILENKNAAIAEANMAALEERAAKIVREKEDRKHIGQRLEEYPSIRAQLDYVFKVFAHLKATGVDIGEAGKEYVDKIEKIKLKYPKKK